ncbi:MAG: hypothetical protein WDO16_11265 [Bacteroidota bacterium]
MLSCIMKGRLSAVGLTFTCTKTYTLSFASISILVASVVAMPSTFILKGDDDPPISFTEETQFLIVLIDDLKELGDGTGSSKNGIVFSLLVERAHPGISSSNKRIFSAGSHQHHSGQDKYSRGFHWLSKVITKSRKRK